MRGMTRVALAFVLLLGCNEASGAAVEGATQAPFEVRGDASGLLLVWFDEEGQHTAASRDEIPEARRELVRVDDLDLAPEARLDPSQVWVADLREAGEDGRYAVRAMPRDELEAHLAAATTPEPSEAEAAEGDADVIVYGASWCSACRSTEAFLRERNVPFVERDIERDPGARQAMLEAARAAGVQTNGIPVIDFRGEIITGFDRGALERAIARGRTPI